ncbi:MAG: cupin domain-containing protein, partial [Chitinivibrionales bacterium]|nr:cupin domain-containing protein [Chitinivibrionales bacterium]MBD3358587.1 cupin domain-containing protein [Chitinivibrionales bacterium]
MRGLLCAFNYYRKKIKMRPSNTCTSVVTTKSSERSVRRYFDFSGAPFYAGLSHGIAEPTAIHTHNGIEIGGVLEGEGVMLLAGREITLRRDDLFFIDAGTPHWHYARNGKMFTHTWIALPFHAIMAVAPLRGYTRLYEPFIATRRGLTPVLTQRGGLVKLTEQILQLHALHPDFWDLEAWAKILEILVGITKVTLPQLKNGEHQTVSEGIGRIMPAVNHLNIHFAEQTPIDE